MPDPSSGPGASDTRKLTVSCSRCRASKLKCDRKEPCIECVRRGVGHLCAKDTRQPRAKKAKSRHDVSNASSCQEAETEQEDAARTLQHFIHGMPGSGAYSTATLGPTGYASTPDHPNLYWSTGDDSQKKSEQLTLLREVVNAMPEPAIIHVLNQTFITRCQGPIGNIVHTPTYIMQSEKLCECLSLASPEAQAMALFDTIPMDRLASHILALSLALAFHPTPSLLGWTSTPLSFRLEELRASNIRSRKWRPLALRCLQDGISLFCGSIASLQAAAMLLLDGQGGPLSLDAILVTAISGAQRLGLHRLDNARLKPSASATTARSIFTEGPCIRTEIGVRIWWALAMRDWSRGQALGYYSIQPSQFNTRMPLHINDDDLSPTTLQVDFHGHLTERPRSEFTMLSYTVYALEIAVMVRKSIDLRYPLREAQNQGKINQEIDGRNHLNNDYEQFLTSLPYHFRLGSTVGLSSTDCMAAIPVHRWMLHQQLWSLFLTIHSTSLSSASSRASCRLLAQNIISTQAQIQARCTVCGSLPTNETQLFNAAIVLLIDLLLLSKHKDSGESSIQLNRIMARDKIQEAIELLRARCDAEDSFSQQGSRPDQIPPSPRTATLLEELMQLEKSESSESEERNTPTSTESRLSQELRIDPGISLKEKVTHILDRFREPSKTKAPEPTAATTNMILIPSPDVSVLNPPTSISISTDGLHLQELDVLPMLSNDHEFGFWSSLDVPSLSAMDNRGDSTPSAEEFQLYTDPGACWPFTPPLGETPHITY